MTEAPKTLRDERRGHNFAEALWGAVSGGEGLGDDGDDWFHDPDIEDR